MIAHGIEPWVTLYHWELPSALHDKTETGGWLGTKVIQQYADYADFCFKTYGNKIKRWLTFNEPWTFSWIGYGSGVHAPGRCTDSDYDQNCTRDGGGGNSSTEPYIVVHHVILAHATAVRNYKDNYQKTQNGLIGWTLSAEFYGPRNITDPDDIEAADWWMQFATGWFMDPVHFGKYPDIMVKNVGDRLPKFTDEESKLIKGTYDFIGLNHYSSLYAYKNLTIKPTDWQSDS